MNAERPRDFVNHHGQHVRYDAENHVTVDGVPIPDDQRWFWAEEWQGGEADVDAQIAAGQVTRFSDEAEMSEFVRALAVAINIHGKDNEADTPDFILAEFLAGCLDAFTDATHQRETWFGRLPEEPEPLEAP